MAIVNSTNYSGYSPLSLWATADADQFNRTHVANPAQALEQHVHGGFARGQGLSVLNLNSTASTNTNLANAGDVLINSSHFTYNDANANPHTLANLDSATFTGTLIIPVSAGAAPTVSGTIAYDSTSNTYKVGVNGSTQQLLSLGGGSVLSVSNGGTGRSNLTAHTVLVGEGTGNINQVGPGTSAYPLISNGNNDPSYQQLTGSGVAAGTITGTNIASGTITGDNIAAATITSSNMASGAMAGNLATVVAQLSGSTSSSSTVQVASQSVTLHGSSSTLCGVITATGVGGGAVNLYVALDGGAWTQIATEELAGDNNTECMAGVFSYNGLSGAHTIDIGANANSGTVTLNPIGFIAFER